MSWVQTYFFAKPFSGSKRLWTRMLIYVSWIFPLIFMRFMSSISGWRKLTSVPEDLYPELGEFFEGDIILPAKGKGGIRFEEYRWPKGVIPYEISKEYGDQQRKQLINAMDFYRKVTCINFVRRTTEPDYVIFSIGRGCSSHVGRQGGSQKVVLNIPGCMRLGTIEHEMMHAVGFIHEHSRPDRDAFVDIKWNNINDKHTFNFKMEGRELIDTFGVEYDYGSVMHYPMNAFAREVGALTIVNKFPTTKKIGQRDSLSEFDIEKINRMYNCTNKLQKSTPTRYNKTKAKNNNRFLNGIKRKNNKKSRSKDERYKFPLKCWKTKKITTKRPKSKGHLSSVRLEFRKGSKLKNPWLKRKY